jgi:hypothetical protein
METTDQRIRANLRWLRHHDPLRQAADALLRGQELPAYTVEYAFEAVSNLRPFANRRREVALWLLQRLLINEEDAGRWAGRLSALVEREVARNRTRGRSTRWFLRTIGVIATLIFIPAVAAFVASPEIRELMAGHAPRVLFGLTLATAIVGILSWPLSYPFSAIWDGMRCTRARKAVEALGLLGLPETIGVLAGAISASTLRGEAAEGLRKVAPALTPEHYGIFDRRVAVRLCRALAVADKAGDEGTMIAIVQALGKIGDGQALPVVERLMLHGSERLKQEAGTILPTLRRRAEEAKAAATLLRPSDDGAGQEVLLRAAGGAGSAEQEQLLRAHVGTDT